MISSKNLTRFCISWLIKSDFALNGMANTKRLQFSESSHNQRFEETIFVNENVFTSCTWSSTFLLKFRYYWVNFCIKTRFNYRFTKFPRRKLSRLAWQCRHIVCGRTLLMFPTWNLSQKSRLYVEWSNEVRVKLRNKIQTREKSAKTF